MVPTRDVVRGVLMHLIDGHLFFYCYSIIVMMVARPFQCSGASAQSSGYPSRQCNNLLVYDYVQKDL